MFLVYYISVTTIGVIVTDWSNDILFGEMIMGGLGTWMEGIGVQPWLIGLVVEGMIGGVGAIVVLIIASVIFKMIRDKKKGVSSCKCNCANCQSSGMCHSK